MSKEYNRIKLYAMRDNIVDTLFNKYELELESINYHSRREGGVMSVVLKNGDDKLTFRINGTLNCIKQGLDSMNIKTFDKSENDKINILKKELVDPDLIVNIVNELKIIVMIKTVLSNGSELTDSLINKIRATVALSVTK